MPTYRNDSDEIIVAYGESFRPGEDQAIGQYVDHSSLIFVSHAPLLAESEHKELRVEASAEQRSITPATGKRIRVYGFQTSQSVTVNLAASLRASLSFGTGGISDSSKVIVSYRQNKADDTESMAITGINLVGDIDETVTLTNITFTGGGVITRAVVYYNEE